MEIQVGQHEIEQIAQALEMHVAPGQPEGDVAFLAAVDPRRAEALREDDGLGDARLQLGKACFIVFPARYLAPASRAAPPLTMSVAICT